MGFDKDLSPGHLSPPSKIEKQGYSWEMRPSPDGPDHGIFHSCWRERLRILGPVAGASHKSRTYQKGWRKNGRKLYRKKCQMNSSKQRDRSLCEKKWWLILGPSIFYDDET